MNRVVGLKRALIGCAVVDDSGERHVHRPTREVRAAPFLVLLVVALFVSTGLPVAANATMAFDTHVEGPEAWVSSNDDGTEATYIGPDRVAQVSPNGELVATEHAAAFVGWELMIYDLATRKRRVRLTHMHTIGENTIGEVTAFAWSPDSTMVAVLQNERRSRKQTLYVIRARGGQGKTRIATGHFRGVSFSPDSKEVVFGLAQTDGKLANTDIARARVTGGPISFLTHDHISGWPLWGPRGHVAFSKRSKTKRWKWRGQVRTSELFDLFVMKPNGRRVKRVTTIGAFEAGFFPAFWFPSGGRLIANFQSLDKNYAAIVDLANGAVRPLNPPISGAGLGVGDVGFAAVSLTADEQTVLGCFGSVVFGVPPPASVPITGGEPTVLNQDVYSPSWSGLPTVGTSPC